MPYIQIYFMYYEYQILYYFQQKIDIFLLFVNFDINIKFIISKYVS